MTTAGKLHGLAEYVHMARALSADSHLPVASVFARLLLSRLLYNRSPLEFDLERFATKSLRDWRGYMTRDEMTRLQEAVAPRSARPLEEDKALFAEYCEDHGLPVVPTLAVVHLPGAEVTAARRAHHVTTEDEMVALLASAGSLEGFAKPLHGSKGYGMRRFAVRDGLVVPSGRVGPSAGSGDAAAIFAHCARSRFAEQGYLLQPSITPHEAIRPFMPGDALGTFRVNTFLMPDGRVEMPFAGFKVPGAGQIADNVHSGGFLVGVDLATGTLRHGVGRTPDVPVAHEIHVHPHAGARITGTRIPFWSELLLLLERAARTFRMLPALGWDVAITSDGPVLIEANWAFGLSVPERQLNRGFAAEYRALYARLARESY